MVRPLTKHLFDSLVLDQWPREAAVVDFGLQSQSHYEALYYPVRAGEITVEQLDDALGSGEMLTELVQVASNPHKDIVFRTLWDDWEEE